MKQHQMQHTILAILLSFLVAFSYTMPGIAFAEEAAQDASSEAAAASAKEQDTADSVDDKADAAAQSAQKEAAQDDGKADSESEPSQEATSQEAALQETIDETASQEEETSSAEAADGGQAESSDAESGEEASSQKSDNAADSTLSDGTYRPDAFTFTGGSGKATMTCDKVIIKSGQATAVLSASATTMTHIFMGKAPSNNETPSLYDPATNTCGEDVYPITEQTVSVPVTINEKAVCAVRTTAMSSPHWVNYTYQITLDAASEKISDSTDIPKNGASSAGDDPAGQGDGELGTTDPGDSKGSTGSGSENGTGKSSRKQTLTTGTWKVKATTDRKMFYLYPKDTDPAQVILKVKADKTMTATITLTGEGYDYVYMGTPSQAKKAGKKNWIKGTKVNGYYTFTIPVSKLDKKLTITPHSKKYESDGDITTEPWRPDKWIIFYSSGAVKVKDGTTISVKKKSAAEKTYATSGTQKTFSNDNKADKVSKWADDSGKSTAAVDSKTSLKDGVYTPDRFSWSGGSGRLAYIRCNKITVKGGQAYATIEFGSSKYDSLKANGRVYAKQGGGNATFVIPVKLNANNTIIGRTTAMSQPHWVKYTIFIYKAGATGKGSASGDDGHLTNTKKLSDKAPDLLGLKTEDTGDTVKNAKYFQIFHYENDITLISIDQAAGTALYTEETAAQAKDQPKQDSTEEDKAEQAAAPGGIAAAAAGAQEEEPAGAAVLDEAEAAGESVTQDAEAVQAVASAEEDAAADDTQPKVEYDEEGNPIAKSESEITYDLYQNNVINYLIVPKDAELPAGLEKDCIIIEKPVKNAYIASAQALDSLVQLEAAKAVKTLGMEEADVEDAALQKALKSGKLTAIGSYETLDYRTLVQAKTDLAVLPSEALPEKLTKQSDADAKAASEAKTETIHKIQKRFSALAVPMLVDRSQDEANNLASAEWIKVYGAIFGQEKTADKLYDQYLKEHQKQDKKEGSSQTEHSGKESES